MVLEDVSRDYIYNLRGGTNLTQVISWTTPISPVYSAPHSSASSTLPIRSIRTRASSSLARITLISCAARSSTRKLDSSFYMFNKTNSSQCWRTARWFRPSLAHGQYHAHLHNQR